MERLSALDASFLYLERPSVHMHVAGLGILDPATRGRGMLAESDLARLIEERIHMVPRFRQKVVVPPFGAGRPVWVDDPGFDLSFHLRRTALPSPGGRRELAEFVQRVHSRPLDRTKPLWEMYLIEGLEDGYLAILSKSHHAMIDGISGMDIATVLFDLTPEPQRIEPRPWEPEPPPSGGALLVQGVFDQVVHPIEGLVTGIRRALGAPQDAVEQAGRLLGGLRSLAALGPAPAGPFNVPVGPNRRFAMAEVSVTEAKSIKGALGGTVNDVVLAAVAGALRALLRARGHPVKGQTLRAMVPVSTRDPSRRTALGNEVSMFFVELPVGEANPARRLRRIIAATRRLKSSHQALAAEAIMGSARWAPATLHGLAARLLARQRFVNLVISNVPGPQVPLYLDGARLLAAFPVMPLGQNLALSVAVTSLSGVMGFGFTTDWDAGADIDVLVDGLLGAFRDLRKAAERTR